MSYEYYIFAGFVFLLLIAVLYLNQMFKKSRSDGDARDDRERKLYALYQNLDEEMLALDADIGRARSENDEKLKRMEELLRKMEALSAEFSDETERTRAELNAAAAQAQAQVQAQAQAQAQAQVQPITDVSKPELQKHEAKRSDEKKLLKRRSPRAEQVRKMHGEGIASEEIARDLAISRGEVELILGIGK
jgi:peptidoglycan hydrolase CwlO-like protein